MSTRCAKPAEASEARHSWPRPSHWMIIQGAAGGNESGAGTTVGAALRARMFLPVPVLDGVKQTDDRLVGRATVSRDTLRVFFPFLFLCYGSLSEAACARKAGHLLRQRARKV